MATVPRLPAATPLVVLVVHNLAPQQTQTRLAHTTASRVVGLQEMTDLHTRPDDTDTGNDNDDFTHMGCCQDEPSRPRAFCSIILTTLVPEDTPVDCVVCVHLMAGLERTGVCPIRRTCCPQFDDLCEGS